MGAKTDREVDIGICATDHIQRVAFLYPNHYEPNYHVDVFKDIRELFFITLTTNRKNILSKDSRAVGIHDTLQSFEEAEAREIVSRTSFVSECSGIWQIEVKSCTHAGTLVEATAERADAKPHDSLTSAEPSPDIDEDIGRRIPPVDDKNTLRQERKDMEDKLEREYQAIEDAKEDLASDERAQMFKLMEIEELKKQFRRKLADLRKVETTTLPSKRETIKNMDRKYYSMVNTYRAQGCSGS